MGHEKNTRNILISKFQKSEKTEISDHASLKAEVYQSMFTLVPFEKKSIYDLSYKIIKMFTKW